MDQSAPPTGELPLTAPARAAVLVEGAIWFAFLGATLFRWSIADRGLDFTDESFALLAARHARELTISPSLFFDYTGPLLTLAGGDIAAVRRLGILLFLAASAVLALGLRTWMRPRVDPAVGRALFPIIGLGSLIYYSRGVSVPNYNHITAWGLATGFGLLLLTFRKRGWVAHLATALAGFALAVAAGAKPPAVVAGLAAAVLVPMSGQGIAGLVALIAGAATAVSISLVHRTPTELVDLLRSGTEFTVTRGYGYALLPALRQYAVQTGQLLVQTGLFAAPSILVFFALRARRPRLLGLLAPIVMLLGVLWVNDALLGGRSAARAGRTTAAILAAILVCALPSLIGASRSLAERKLVLAALLLPALGALGTNTHFASALLLFLAPWFVIVPLLLESSTLGRADRLARGALPALIAAIAATTAPYISPYGLTAPFSEQTVAATVGDPRTTILTDRQTARFLGRLEAAARACGFVPGNDVIGLMDMPGFVFALGGVSPAIAYYPREGDHVHQAIQMAMSRVPEDRLRRSFVLLNDHALRLGAFTIGGRAVPDDYDVCFDRDGPSKYGDMRVRLLKPRPPDRR